MGKKFGIVGCGRQAPKHISGIAAHGGMEVVVADLDCARAEAFGQSHRTAVCDSAEEIFADPDVVAVSICTPPASHGGLIRDAIEAGKHFICEKPLTDDLAEARALEAEATRAGVVGMVGYLYRFAPAFELGARALAGTADGRDAAALGRVSSAFFRLGGPGSHGIWQHVAKSGGGVVNEMFVHMADLALWYFGAVESAEIVAAEIRQPEREIDGQTVRADVEDWVLARLRSHGGADIWIEADLTTPTFVQYAEIHGDNGSFMGSIQSDMPTFVHCLEERAGFARGRTPFAFEPANLYVPQIGLFLDAVAGKTRLDRCTLANSIRLLELIEAMKPGGRQAEG